MTSTRTLTERVQGVVEPELKAWLTEHAEKNDRSEAAIVRYALRDYRAKVSRRRSA